MEDLKDRQLGFLGMGAMGFPICHGLVRQGYHVKLPTWRRASAETHGFSPLARDAAEKHDAFDWMLSHGGSPADSQRELLEACDIVLLSLPTSRQVEEVISGPDGVLEVCRPGTVVIDLTSADPASTRSLAGRLESRGMELLDAPVSGGTSGAAAQTLAVMVGGKEETFTRFRPIFETIGAPEKVFYLGPSGAGDLVKCANNFLGACAAAATSEALCLCAKAGVDPRKAAQVIDSSSGRNASTNEKFPKVVFPGKQWAFTVGLMCKDVGLFTGAARDLGVPALLGGLTEEILQMQKAASGPEADLVSLPQFYERLADVRLYGIDP